MCSHGGNLVSPFKQLEFSAKESFDALAARCAALERFRGIIFEEGNSNCSNSFGAKFKFAPADEEDDAMDGLGRGLGMEDLLLALSPFHLLTPGQILLQFLINRCDLLKKLTYFFNNYALQGDHPALDYFILTLFSSCTTSKPIQPHLQLPEQNRAGNRGSKSESTR